MKHGLPELEFSARFYEKNACFTELLFLCCPIPQNGCDHWSL